MLIEDLDVEVVVAEHLGLDEQTLAEVARADTDGIELHHQAEDLGRIFGVDAGLVRELFDREVGGACSVGAFDAFGGREALIVEVSEHELREALLRVGHVAHLDLPAQMVDERFSLGEVLLDRRHLLEPAAVGGERLLQRAVLEELLPVDLVRLLVVGLLRLAALHPLPGRRACRDAALALLHRRRLDGGGVVVLGGPGARLEVLVGEDRVRVAFLTDFFDRLQPGQLQ